MAPCRADELVRHEAIRTTMPTSPKTAVMIIATEPERERERKRGGKRL